MSTSEGVIGSTQHASTVVQQTTSPHSPSTTLNTSPSSNDVEKGQGDEKQYGDHDRIRGVADVLAALRLTWSNQRKHLFVTWIHVPFGVMLLLVVCWSLRLLIDLAPFRFPAPVIAMMLFFVTLLALDWLSTFGQQQPDTDHHSANGHSAARKRKRFLDPVMALLAPPCEFLLRNMSVMFTPSFILIPAREVIPGKEIGLIAAWFTASQILAFVIPVWLNLAVEKSLTWYKQVRPQKRDEEVVHDSSRRPSVATLSGVVYEKGMGFNGGDKLSAIATGLSGLTAHIIAPVTHLKVVLDPDERRQLESTVMEAARQQGDPAVTCSPHWLHRTTSQGKSGADHQHLHPHHPLSFDAYKPKSDVSNFHHHHHHRHGHAARSSSRRSVRSRSRGASDRPALPTHATEVGQGYRLERPRIHTSFSLDTSFQRSKAPVLPTQELQSLDVDVARRIDGNQGSPIEVYEERTSRDPTVRPIGDQLQVPPQAAMLNVEDSISPHQPIDHTHRPSVDVLGGEVTAVPTPRPSKEGLDATDRRKITFTEGSKMEDGNKMAEPESDDNESDSSDDDEEEEETAVERLASWFGDLITPTVYFIAFIVGIPLFFLKDFALPLFLGINLLTFIAAITIVPPKIRRFLHPILSTSFATVMIIWAFAAMKGISLNDCLNRFYSVDARYSVLWSPSGYRGPVPGAGDILFSTLDAGIVALAVPMYRYRRELWQNLTRMLVILFPCAALSLFFWNFIARLIGMDSVRSLAFTARFMSTPLAIELANNVGADESITVILVVITGVVAAIFKEAFFYKLMRVRRDDYLTVGLTMGSTSGAIGASSLISTPRTMAIASLSFVMFGTILLVCTAIPPIVDIVRSVSS